jgi:hypothetical protein
MATGEIQLVKIVEGMDVSIGTVELKDADSTTQANIKVANTARTTGTVVLATQLVTAEVVDDASAVTASAAANYSLYQLYIDSVAMTNAERAGFGFPIIAAALVGTNSITHKFKWIVPSYRVGTLVNLYAKQNSATTGNWVISSGATGETRLSYKKIA